MKKRVLLLAPLLIACGPYFTQAPPPLEKYPARTAGKDWRELFDAAKPPNADAMAAQAIRSDTAKIATEFPTLTPERRKEAVQYLIEHNREGEFSERSATLLQELAELAALETLPDFTSDYLAWRSQTLTRKPAGAVPRRKWSDTDETYRLALEGHAASVAEDLAWLEQGRAATPPPLLPNFEVHRAGFLMKAGRLEEALAGFRQVIQSVPDHPRAEAARFMIGRCLLDQARAAARAKQGGETELRRQATEALQAYLQKHPQGRFVPDAHGWLGAVATDEQRYGDAVKHQLNRLAARSTRETLQSVMRECDSLFVALCENPRVEAEAEQLARSLPWRAIARSPEITRLFVYQALDPASRHKLPLFYDNDSGDLATVDFLNERIVRPRQFAKRGLSLLGGAMLQEDRDSDPLTLTVLGWSSIRAAEAEQALGLFDKALRKGRSDELLQGRAAALSAMGSYARAVAAYDELEREFADSPLAASAAFDAAIAAYKAGETGEAILRLGRVREFSYDENAKPNLHPEFEASQWRDAIAHSAPIGHLAAPLNHLLPENPDAALLHAIVRYRALAAHRFDIARRHLSLPQEEEEEQEDGETHRYNQSWHERFAMDQAQWDRDIEPLAGAYAKLAKKPNDAALQLETGLLWKSLRGRATMPLHWLFRFSNSEPDKIDGLRRKNGIFLGFGPKKVTAMLDAHDELHHALGHFLAAAEAARDPAVAALALEEANEALLHLYEFSPYRMQRAQEDKHMALSARLVGRLKKEFPGTPQAARAVAWVFTGPPLSKHPWTSEEPWTEEQAWMPGNERHWNADEALREGVIGRKFGYESDPRSDDELAAFRELDTRFKSFAAEEGQDLPTLKTELASIRSDFAKLRKTCSEDSILYFVDRLDDFASVVEVPGISADLFRRYVRMRLDHAVPPPAVGEWQPLKPWLAFYDRIRPIHNGDYEGPYNSSPDSWTAYLTEFPDGPKTEAASLQLIRSKVKRACPRPVVVDSAFPAAPTPDGYPLIQLKPAAQPETLDAIPAELAAHEQRFPKGRYHADVLLLRAKVAAAQGDVRAALEAATAILSDPEHPELRLDAALYLSYFGLRLLEPGERVAVADAFRSCPAALPFLRNLVNGETCLFRLRPLMPWLEARTTSTPPRDPRSPTP